MTETQELPIAPEGQPQTLHIHIGDNAAYTISAEPNDHWGIVFSGGDLHYTDVAKIINKKLEEHGWNLVIDPDRNSYHLSRQLLESSGGSRVYNSDTAAYFYTEFPMRKPCEIQAEGKHTKEEVEERIYNHFGEIYGTKRMTPYNFVRIPMDKEYEFVIHNTTYAFRLNPYDRPCDTSGVWDDKGLVTSIKVRHAQERFSRTLGVDPCCTTSFNFKVVNQVKMVQPKYVEFSLGKYLKFVYEEGSSKDYARYIPAGEVYQDGEHWDDHILRSFIYRELHDRKVFDFVLGDVRVIDNTPFSWFHNLRNILHERSHYDLRATHPAVEHVLIRLQEKPANMHLLALENPTIAEDGERVAYTRSEENRERGRNTATSIGKYLRRHFPQLKDNIIRDLAGLYCADEFTIWEDLDGIVRSCTEGPHSCMKDPGGFPDTHPYEVYDPKYGWSVAVRLKGKKIVGRALLNNGGFVRSYRAAHDNPDSTDYSHSDDALEAWLQNEGYEHFSSWDGAKVAKVSWRGGYIMPYLDGGISTFDDCGDCFLITEEGAYTADSTDGTYQGATRCENCADHMTEDDTYTVQTINEVQEWCENCADELTTWAYGPEGETRYRNRDFGFVTYRGDLYVDDPDNLAAHNLVVIDDEVYGIDDVIQHRNGEYVLKDDTRLEEDGITEDNIHDYDYVEVDGTAYDGIDVVWCQYQEEPVLKKDATKFEGGWVSDKDIEAQIDFLLKAAGRGALEEFFGDDLEEYCPQPCTTT